MKFLDEYRDPALARALIEQIQRTSSRPWVVMEVCGGQTHAIVRGGIDLLLAGSVELVHGPGCPVCVTSTERIDLAHAIARQPGVIFTSFGDMLRVPGSAGDLLTCRAAGADVRVVYSPLDALELARREPEREVVFFAVGFETTAPATATAAWQARREGVSNFSLLDAHVLVPPTMRALLESPGNRVQAFLGPGHVCTVVGTKDYEGLAAAHHTPIVVSGFEPLDILEGILRAVEQLEAGEARVVNQYSRVVSASGNPHAQRLVEEVYEPCDRAWRGLGTIPLSGLRLRADYAAQDAGLRYQRLAPPPAPESQRCISGQILSGQAKPCDCPAFGSECTPERPLGATMVSGEGACAAYFAVGRHQT
ncbi:MAG TPA: hydrogenase formation protein HypD [Planctomycetes bacterium]|nr:hydrogenase formation protein HypD [Planctomycetota bacterium]